MLQFIREGLIYFLVLLYTAPCSKYIGSLFYLTNIICHLTPALCCVCRQLTVSLINVLQTHIYCFFNGAVSSAIYVVRNYRVIRKLCVGMDVEVVLA